MKPSKQKNARVSSRNYALIPILFVICVIPLLMKLYIYDPCLDSFSWSLFPQEAVDVFLHCKANALITTALFMFIILAVAVYINLKKGTYTFKDILKPKWIIPLISFGLLALISTLLSEHRYFGFNGITEQFESIWVVLAYCIVTLYAFYFIRTNEDINIICKGLFIVLALLCAIGLTQLVGHDFWESNLGKSLFVPDKYSELKDSLHFNFSGSGNHQVYLTFYNPNYVGMFTALVLPITLLLCLSGKTWVQRMAWGILSILIFLCALGSGSKAFLLSFVLSACIGIIFLICKNIKYMPVITAIISVFVIAINAYSTYTNININQYVKNALTPKSNPSYIIEDFIVEKDCITLKYNGSELSISYDSANYTDVSAWDENGAPITYYIDEYDYYHFEDERFADVSLTFYPFHEEYPYVGEIYVATKIYNFTTINNEFVFLNYNLMPDTIQRAESALFTNYDRLFSGRGYLWSRTIPLLKDTIIFGTGADTFTIVFPQNDYVARANAGYAYSLITKPHSMYLQSAVQYGVAALICYLIVIVIYLLQTFILCWKSNFKTRCSYLAFGISLGIIGYCISGISNDSCVALAPMAWVLLGIGFATNKILSQTKETAKS